MKTQHYSDLLTAEKERIENDLSQIGHADPKNPRDWQPDRTDMDTERSDAIDTADNAEEFHENVAIVNELEVRLNAIKEALSRIEDKTYGTCVTCKNPIEEDRLEANPAATTCKAHMG